MWPDPDLNYRTYVQKWVGTPFFPPSGAVRNNGGKATVYASWDGATQVASWRVLAGSSAGSLKAVASKAKNGFETTIPLTGTFKVYKVQALDSTHHVLGTSNAFPTELVEQRPARRSIRGSLRPRAAVLAVLWRA